MTDSGGAIVSIEQKAREWVNTQKTIRSIAVNKQEPIEIITELLAEIGRLKQDATPDGMVLVKDEPVLMVNAGDLTNEWYVGINAVKKKHQDYGKRYNVPLYAALKSGERND